MEVVRKISGYETSKDYHRLFDLAHQQSIICLCWWDDSFDIARTIFADQYFAVSARGTGYVTADSETDFIAQCKQCALEWVAPNNHLQPTQKARGEIIN